MEQPKKTLFEIAVMEIIKKMREERKLSQVHIAGILGVSPGYIGQIEMLDNPSTYNINHFNRLAHEFKCSPADFLPKKPIEEPDWKK